MSNQIRIKLEKFVSGPQQRIFKTKTKFLHDQLNYLNTYLNFYFGLDQNNSTELSAIIGRSDIFHGEYNSEKLNIAKAENQSLITGDLINFHDINIEYLTNNPNKNTKLSYNGMASPWFPVQAEHAELDQVKNKDQRITYFPTYIQTPIDIAYNNENAYLLLPLGTDKFTNIVQSESNLNIAESVFNSYETDYKPNYKNMISAACIKPYQYAEDNSIPIYDLNFSFVETIKFNPEINILDWLTNNNLNDKKINNQKYLSSVILFNSQTNQFGQENADSIYTKPFFEYVLSSHQIRRK